MSLRRRFYVVMVSCAALMGSTLGTAVAQDPNLATPPPSALPHGPTVEGLTSADAPSVLIYGPTAGGLADSTPGITVTVWDAATWSTKSTSDFAAFDAIAFGDEPICFSDESTWSAAIANRQVWSAAITGNILINGTDPDYHQKPQFVQQAVQFAYADARPGPGLYVSLSCAYHSQQLPVAANLLSGLGSFSVAGVVNCPNDAHKVAEHPTLAGIDDAYLSNWSCSTHEVFSSWPGSFQPLAVIQDAQNANVPIYHAADGQDGLVYILARGASSICPPSGDADGDCLSDATELQLGTSPTDPDSDDDGLLDSWEVGRDIPGHGIHLASGVTVDMEDAFGPFGDTDPRLCPSTGAASDGRMTQATITCLNPPPNPLRKDILVEIDWQDCAVEAPGQQCAELAVAIGPVNIDAQFDPMHHAPSLSGLLDVINDFSAGGISLHILVDEAVPHEPNCDQDSAAGRPSNFGTPAQRLSQDVIAARTLGVRYVWSGHSSAAAEGSLCPTPSPTDFIFQGFGVAHLPTYDYTAFGDANVGGRDILLTLGPAWTCPSYVKFPEKEGLCFRRTYNVLEGGVAVLPGIFPATLDGPSGAINWTQPIHRLLGESERDAVRQLWSRSLMHLLGHSLGLSSESDVRNEVAPPGRHQGDDHALLGPLMPDSYATWQGLILAPVSDGQPMSEQKPDYNALAFGSTAQSDPDNDGKVEGLDNCPGVYNPDQGNLDYSVLIGARPIEFGDACDQDIDGDGLPNSTSNSTSAALAPLAAEAALDPYPYDTDNDGIDNVADPDDDGDGVADGVDNCPLVANPSRADMDGDGAGDACDADRDGDGIPDGVESQFGSNPNSGASRPEYVGVGSTCADGSDNDGDGSRDGADAGCLDVDLDGVADSEDNCPQLANPSQLDLNADGIGDTCQLRVHIVYAPYTVVTSDHDPLTFGWTGSSAGQFAVRLGGTDCATGSLIDSGTYDPGTGAPAASFFTLATSQLSEGTNRVRVCLTTPTETAQTTETITLDNAAPATPTIALAPESDSGTAGDGMTNADPVTMAGTAEPASLVALSRDGTPVDAVVADATGHWGIADASVPEGSHTYSAASQDPAGNPSAGSGVATVRVERTRPSSAAGPLNSSYSTSSVSVPFTATDNFSGVDHVELWSRYRATQADPWGAWTIGPSGTSSPITYTFGANGLYEFYTIAIDRAGNREAAPASADAATEKVAISTATGKAWGNNSQGQLGNGTLGGSSTPLDVLNLTGITSLGAGAEHSLAVKSDGTVWAWGQNANGELGDGTITDRLTPVRVSGLSGAVAVAGGTAHSLVLKSDGTVWAFGLNANGQLGDGSTTQRTTAVRVSGLTGVIAIAAGSDHSLALKSDGTVWAWGKNTSGQLGDGSKQKRTTPVRVGTLTGMIAIAAGGDHSLGVKSDGTVWAWGYNFYGELGDGTTTNRLSPVRATGLSGAVSVAAGSNHSLARKGDGTVWAWGNNGLGQLGDGTNISRSSPIPSGTLSGVTALAAGAHHSMALKSDGTLWAWGYNAYGQLGDGTTTNRSSAVRVGSLSGIARVAAGAFFSLAATGS